MSVIEDLQNHSDRAVYKAATDILSSFFELVSTQLCSAVFALFDVVL